MALFRRATLDRFAGERLHGTVHVDVASTLPVGWLMPRLAGFEAPHPSIDLRNAPINRVDLAAEGLDLAVRFGDGRWHGTNAAKRLPAARCRPVGPGPALRTAPLRRASEP